MQFPRFIGKNKTLTIIASTLLLTLSFIFFSKLFFPSSYVIVTPDFQISDLWDYTFAEKFFLGHGLRTSSFNEYTNLLMNGLSLTADGQIGYLNPINYLAFRFLPMPFAFNMGYIFAFFIAGLGTFLLAKRFGLDFYSSLLSSISFMFSGMMIFKISHYTLLQNIAIIPLIILVVDSLLKTHLKKKKLIFSLLLSVLLNLQFSNGQFQITFITFVGIFFYLVFSKVLSSRLVKLNDVLFFLISFVLFIILAIPEMISVGDLYFNSVRNSNLNYLNSLSPSFQIKNIFTLINPYILGSPKNGSYINNGVSGDIFWESNLYIGILPFILLLLSLFFSRKTKLFKLLIFLTAPFFLLMLGEGSPAYLFLLMFPFNIFRAPTRFISFVVFPLCILAGLGLNSMKKKLKRLYPIISILIISITVIDLFIQFYAYHPVAEYKTWIKAPETINFLKNKKNNTYYSIGLGKVWIEFFSKNGWENKIASYKSFQNGLTPKLNLIYQIPSTQTFASSFFMSKDDFYFLYFINSGINYNGSSISLSGSSRNILKMAGTDYLISPFSLQSDTKNKIAKVFETKFDNSSKTSFKIYELQNPYSDIFFARKIKYFRSENDFLDLLEQSGSNEAFFDHKTKVKSGLTKEDFSKDIILVKENSSTHIKLSTTTNLSRLVVINRTFSPYWKAKIDNKPVQIYKTNWKMQSLIVPSGNHNLDLYYDFTVLRYSIIVRNIFYFSVIVLMIFLIFRRA